CSFTPTSRSEIFTLSLHDALPILAIGNGIPVVAFDSRNSYQGIQCTCMTDNAQAAADGAEKLCGAIGDSGEVALIVQDSVSGNADRKSTRLNSSHVSISYAVFCLK